jgi:hypothetical protein
LTVTDQCHQLVQKLWNYCNIVRDDGLSYGDDPSALLRAGSEQLTFLLFIKMVDEQSRPPFNKPLADSERSRLAKSSESRRG